MTNVLILNDLSSFQMTSFIQNIVEYIVTKYVCFSDFAVRLVKQENFLNVVDLYII